MRLFLALCLATSFLPNVSKAVEPKNPETLCERYLGKTKQDECKQKIQRISPDWYLAATCDKIFDDSYFWECLEMNTIASFNPNKVGECQNSTKDYDIVECVKSVAQWSASDDGQAIGRAPATVKKHKKHKAKK